MKIVLYDGDCGFCNRSVERIWKRDPDGIFSFASIQSDTGRRLLRERGIEEPLMDTFYLIEGERVYERSEAALRVARELHGFHLISKLLSPFPRPFLNLFYNLIAKHRHRLKGEACSLPPSHIRSRFL